MTDEPTSSDVKRHYLRVREGARVDPQLRAYCGHATFHSYSAADIVRREKLAEYRLKDPTVIEIVFRR
ncbi:MAG: hypothetical protein J4400_05975 [Candidatus Aenigmarchaeota archaeon]|nr:hypothetical protein [Candidatus Aenigmarchaeota archaeon]